MNSTTQNERNDRKESYVCIECDHKMQTLFKIYQDGFNDIRTCPKCDQCVDIYLECENMVILIDLVLLKKKTYRHILINKSFEISVLIKFLITFLLCDAYLYWFNLKNRQFESIRTNDQELFYELEWNFYYMLIRAIINYLIYSTIIVFLCCFEFLISSNTKNKSLSSLKKFTHSTLKALTISSFGKLVVLPLVIWNPSEVYFNLGVFFTCLSNFQALSVVTRMHNVKMIGIIFIAAMMSLFSNQFLKSISQN